MMYRSSIKPLFDRAGALVLLLLLVPLMLAVAAGITVFLGRPVLFSQKRPGLNGKIFTIYKFRTMSDERDAEGKLLSDEKRLGGFGKFIRGLSLDELPQLFNVLKGDMSFIGPRPLLIEYLPLYSAEQKKRHDVKPGITGWAQVNGRNAIGWKEKFELDVYYVEHISFWLDCKIAGMTVAKIVKRSDITAQNHVTTEKFNGNN